MNGSLETESDAIDDVGVADGWESRTLGELADDERGITYGIVQPGHHVIGGVPIVRVQNIVDGTLETSDVMRVAPEIAAKYRRTCLRGGELLLSLVGSVGSSVIAPPEFAGWNTARAVAVVPLRSGIDARWVRFCLRSAPLQHLMEVWCNTTVQATLNLNDVRRLPIPLPPTREREAIVAVLGALDDKIELNRRMNRTLEELAGALFRAWFVDFEPVVAQAAGRAPFGLAPAVAALFPASFSDSELGPIPQGWRVCSLDEIADPRGGGTPKTSVTEYWNGDIPWFSVVDSPAAGQVFVLETEKMITARGMSESATQLLPEGTTIVTARGTVGNLALVGVPMTMNQSCYGLVPKNNFGAAYVFFTMQGAVEELRRNAHGSVFDTITRNTLSSISIVTPPVEVRAEYERFATPLLDKIKANVRESRTLAALRDTLLPKLLSGELRVKAAERK